MVTVLQATGTEKRPARRRGTPPLLGVLPSIRVTTRWVQLSLGIADAPAPVCETVVTADRAAGGCARAIGSEITKCVLVIFLNARNRVTG